jgi:Cell wall-active antibiotics response 4TMS YvqF
MSDTLNLSHTFGSIKRGGEWRVPEHIVLRQRMGSAELDLTEADLAATHTVLELDMIGGSVEIRVPEDMLVISTLTTTLASYQDHRSPGPDTTLATATDAPTLAVQGRAAWGSVEVRGPKRSRHKPA